MQERVACVASYLMCCVKSDDEDERERYAESLLRILSQLVVSCKLQGALMTPEDLTEHLFGGIPVEIVETTADEE